MTYFLKDGAGSTVLQLESEKTLHLFFGEEFTAEPMATILLPEPEKIENWRLCVLECHKVLDDAGIPTAKDEPCADPTCKSPLGHRTREIASRLALKERLVEVLRDLLTAVSPVNQKQLVGFHEMVKKLLDEHRRH